VAKKHKKDPYYDEGSITGKKVFLLGMIPVFAFLLFAAIIAYVITDYYNKVTINQDTNDICKYVRNQYKSTLKAEYPCENQDKGDYWLIAFNEQPNSQGIPAIISFKVNKKDKAISPAYSVE
jgi:hypothetical protein